MPELKTVWGENLNPDSILPEYPRPQLVRENYVNLNGRWDHCSERCRQSCCRG